MRAPKKESRSRARRGEAGSSLIEVLIALFIMMILMIGILQMFSVACVVNASSSARTEMTYKCQQIVENLRYIYHVSTVNKDLPNHQNTLILAQAGVNFADGTYNLPYTGGEANYSYWGPNGADVIEQPNGPYRLSYTVVSQLYLPAPGALPGNNYLTITVSAIPVATAMTRFHHKRVDYVATLYQ